MKTASTPQRWLAWIVLVASIGAVFSFGAFGVGRDGFLAADQRYYVVAAGAWLSGVDPYDQPRFQDLSRSVVGDPLLSYAYPPNSFPLGLALVFLPATWAPVAMTILTLAAVGFIALWAWTLGARRGWTRVELLLTVAAVIGNPFTAHAVWTGNVSILIVASIIWAWELRSKKPWVAGALMAIALMKPQLSLLPALWFLMERAGRPLLAATLTTLLFALTPLLRIGPIVSTLGWFHAVDRYASESISFFGFEYVIGIRSALAAAGISTPSLVPLGVVSTVALFLRRRAFSDDSLLGLLLGFGSLLVYAHDYDLVTLVPLLVSCWDTLRVRSARVLLLLSLALMCAPIRLVRILDPHRLVLHWRTAILLGFVACSLFLLREDRDAHLPRGRAP